MRSVRGRRDFLGLLAAAGLVGACSDEATTTEPDAGTSGDGGIGNPNDGSTADAPSDGTSPPADAGLEPPIPSNAIWVDASAPNDSGTGSFSSPKKLIASGAALLPSGGGGTVVVRNGTYAAPFKNSSLKAAPSWAAKNVIRAEHFGGVVVTGGFGITGNTNWFCEIVGFKFDDATQKDVTGGNLKVRHCAFARGETSGNTASLTIGTNDQTPGAHHILLEDCWVYGPGGRYNIVIFNSQDIVLRRVVTRFDGGYVNIDGAPEACITQYDSQRVACLNCLAIDGLGPRPDYVATFYNASNGAGPTPNDTKSWRGCLAVNHLGYLMGSEGQIGITNMTVQDCASFGGGIGAYGVSQLKGTNTLYERLTIVGESGDGVGLFGAASSATVRDSVVQSCKGKAYTASSGATLNLVTSVSFGCGTNGGTVLDALTNGLRYLARIEGGSVLASGGTNGQRGANITKCIGASGTLYGEPGYDTATADDLWPWKNEDRIKVDMSTVTGLTSGQATRGFCAAGQTLTKYVFEKLGNPTPFP